MTEQSSDAARPHGDHAADGRPDEPRRPRPAPGPTSRARRASAAGVEPAVRRPRPSPEAAASPSVALTKTRPRPADEAIAEETEPGKGEVGGGPSSSDEPTPHRVRSSSPLWLAALLLVVILALGGGAWWLHGSSDPAGSVSQRDQALSAAKTSVPLILSYSYQTFDADQAKAKAQLTGKAQSDYATAMTTTIKPAAVKAHVVVQASTEGAGVETVSPDGDQVTVIVFGEQKVTNTSLQAPRIDIFRVRAVLERVGGHWVVSKFNQI